MTHLIIKVCLYFAFNKDFISCFKGHNVKACPFWDVQPLQNLRVWGGHRSSVSAFTATAFGVRSTVGTQTWAKYTPPPPGEIHCLYLDIVDSVYKEAYYSSYYSYYWITSIRSTLHDLWTRSECSYPGAYQNKSGRGSVVSHLLHQHRFTVMTRRRYSLSMFFYCSMHDPRPPLQPITAMSLVEWKGEKLQCWTCVELCYVLLQFYQFIEMLSELSGFDMKHQFPARGRWNFNGSMRCSFSSLFSSVDMLPFIGTCL